MSLASSVNRNDYTGNGATSVYSYSFKLFQSSDLTVIVKDTSTPPVETVLTINTDYTISGVGSTSGGNVTLVNGGQSWLTSGSLKSNYKLTFLRQLDLTQTTDLRNQGDYFPETIEDTFDKSRMIDQQQQDEIDRAVKSPSSVPASDFDPTLPTDIATANKVIIVNSAGDGFEMGPTASEIASAQTYATAASASASAAATSESNAADSETAAAATLATIDSILNPITMDEQGSTPTTPVSGQFKLYPKTDGKLYSLNDSGVETQVGTGGASGINYLLNPDAESDTTGWSAYADAAGTSPVDGTGGTASITLTRTTSSPLRGAASFLITKDAADRQGEGVSYDFTIDSADKNKPLYISFDYEASANYVTDDVKVFVYDVTNAELLTVTLAVDNSRLKARFFSATDSTSYRLILHITSTNASAYTLKFDNVIVGPDKLIDSPIVRDWVSFTPTGNFTNTTYTGKYKRVGDTAQFKIRATLTGTPGSVTAFVVSFAGSGLIADTSKLVGTNQFFSNIHGGGTANGAGVSRKLHLTYDTTTSVAVFYQFNTSGAIQAVTQALPFAWASGDYFEFDFEAPISQWANSNAVLSTSETLNRSVISSYKRTTDQTITTSAAAIIWNSKIVDDLNLFNTSTGEITIPQTGKYKIDLSLRIDTGASASTQHLVTIKNNGTIIAYPVTANDLASTKTYNYGPNYVGSFTAGDVVTIEATSASNNSTLVGSQSFISVQRIQDFSVYGVYSDYKVVGSLNASQAVAGTGYADLTSVALEPGTYNISGRMINQKGASTTGPYTTRLAISLYSGATTTDHVAGINQVSTNSLGIAFHNPELTIPSYVLTLTTPATVYLKGQCDQVIGTYAECYILAKRIR